MPNPENTLLLLGDVSALKVRAEVEERDAAKIRVGQFVVVRADAYPDQDFEGRVSQIAKSLSAPRIATRGPRRPNDVEVLEAVADLDDLPPLLTGMRVDVFFEARRHRLDEVALQRLSETGRVARAARAARFHPAAIDCVWSWAGRSPAINATLALGGSSVGPTKRPKTRHSP